MVTFFDTSRRKFTKFSRLSRTFYTSLSSVPYDSMEFHLTGPYGRDVAHVKEIPSLFLSAWKVPHATCLCARDVLNMSRNFSWNIFASLQHARLAWWNDIVYADFWIPWICVKKPRQFKPSTCQISVVEWDLLTARSHFAPNAKYSCLILISCRNRKTMHSIYIELLFLSYHSGINIVHSSNLISRCFFFLVWNVFWIHTQQNVCVEKSDFYI